MTTNLLGSAPAFTANTGVGGAFTIVAFTDPIYLVHGAVLRTIVLTPPTSGTSPVLDSCWVGPAAETGDSYDFDGTQVQVFFNGGNAGVTLTSGGSDITSDDISLTIDATRNLLVSFHNTGACSFRTKSGEFAVASASKSAVSEASTTDKTSYTTSGSQNSLKGLNVDLPSDFSFSNRGVRAGTGFGASIVFSSTQGLPKNRYNGDLLIGMVSVNNGSAHTWPSPWTQFKNHSNNSVTTSLAYCYVDGSETAPTVTWTGNQAARGMIVNYRGAKADPDGIGNTADNGGNNTSSACTSPATTADNSILVAVLSANNMTLNLTNDASGYTAKAAAANISIQDVAIPSSGGSQNFALTLSPSQVWQTFIVELVKDEPVSGDLDTTEAADTFAATGSSTHTGDLAATEAADTFAGTGTPIIIGDMAVTEAAGVFAATGTSGFIGKSGDMAATETADTFAASGYITHTGSLASTEAPDTFASTGVITHIGDMDVTEAPDVFAGSQGISGDMAATEAADVFRATNVVPRKRRLIIIT